MNDTRIIVTERKLAMEQLTAYVAASVDQCMLHDARSRPTVCGALADAIRIYTGPLIEPMIEVMRLLPKESKVRVYMSVAADVISQARSTDLTLAQAIMVLSREAEK